MCKHIQTFFAEDNIIISEIQSKWSVELNEEISTDYIEILQNIRKLSISAYTKYSLFKLLHSRIATNKKTSDIKLIADATCEYSKAPSETIILAFIECPDAAYTSIWKEVEHWLRTLVDPYIKSSDVEKIFGSKSLNPIINRIIIAIIQTIYKQTEGEKNTTLMKLNIDAVRRLQSANQQ